MGTLAVLERALVSYKRLWQASVFSSFILPVLFVISIGIGVGGYVGDVDGVSYLDWIVPGVLASTAFQMAVGESTFPVLGDFKWVKGYHAMRATPVGIGDMVAGYQLYIAFRVIIAAVVFLGVSAAFGAIHSPWVVVTPFVCALLGVAVSAPTSAFSASIENDSYFALLFRFVVIPSTLFAGVFFPVSQLPALLRPLAYASPLWHAVELCRSATLGVAPPWPVAAHLAYLLLWAVLGYLLAVRAFRRRLSD
ncbi:transport permease protein [Catellatospora sp. IY07-71]|uniref:ABC transporter permease n=1 Tax=Catellatospora sp. IY07-71 TaxID=2728827 RepID=UPI001BB30EB3|nr:ABC transporter permease [Catellatospora sp. IY07-71]BCJ78135.1 transport permease protein [Catellatospora sp. IY07-71]